MKSKKYEKVGQDQKIFFVKTNGITKKYEKVGQDQIMKKKILFIKTLTSRQLSKKCH